jgi:ribosome-binding factor A
MPKEFSRTQRVAQQLQRDLADLIRNEIKDPRVGMVSIISVDVSRDLAHAKVYITSLTADNHAEIIKVLQGAAGFLRRELGKRLMIRIIPQLHFFYDESIERGSHLSHLIDEAVASDQARHKEDEPDTES